MINAIFDAWVTLTFESHYVISYKCSYIIDPDMLRNLRCFWY